jgi:hypothetical protein
MSKISLAPDASGTGIFTIASPNSNTNRTLTLPDDTGTIVTNSGNQAGSFTTLAASSTATFAAGAVGTPAITTTGDTNTGIFFPSSDTIGFSVGGSERARLANTSPYNGLFLINKTAPSDSTVGVEFQGVGTGIFTRDGGINLLCNRLTSDGILVIFQQGSVTEGDISVSGSTVSYNGGHLSRWAQMLTKPELFKGTVMSNLDDMNVYVDADGNSVQNEQLNKVKVSDVEGDANVAGVFVNWTYDEAHQVDEINMAMTGDMIIRIAQGVTVSRGDLLMSAGDGTAKPQGDDIVRSKTIAKVTSTHVTCTYEDGSYCVPCVLMAC